MRAEPPLNDASELQRFAYPLTDEHPVEGIHVPDPADDEDARSLRKISS